MQSIPHTKFLERLVDVGVLLRPFVPDFEVPVWNAWKLSKNMTASWKAYYLVLDLSLVQLAHPFFFFSLLETFVQKNACEILIYSM